MVTLGAGLYVLCGLVHGSATLYDTVRPRFFAPEDDAVRGHMAGTGIRFARLFAAHQTIWRGWLGFNLSHSLGLLVFGGLLLAVEPGPAVVAVATLASAIWTAISARCFFYGPTLAFGAATVLFAATLAS